MTGKGNARCKEGDVTHEEDDVMREEGTMQGVAKAMRQGRSVKDVCERWGSVSERKKRKKMNLTAASRLAFVSGKAQRVQIQQKGRPPSVCEQKGHSACKGKGGFSREKKEKKDKQGRHA